MKTAVVVMNLGGPDSLEAVEPFLYNIFSDPDVIQLPLGLVCWVVLAALLALVVLGLGAPLWLMDASVPLVWNEWTLRPGPLATAGLMLSGAGALLVTAGVFALAAATHIVRYLLMLVNRTTLLPPFVAIGSLISGVLASLAAIVAVVATAVVLTSWLVGRRAAAFARHGQIKGRAVVYRNEVGSAAGKSAGVLDERVLTRGGHDAVEEAEGRLLASRITLTGPSLLHGSLHLLGYDHQDSSQTASMERLQSDIMKSLKLNYRDFKWLV